MLDAGPIVLILTSLVAIFTIGLSDEERQGLSAYSVFNRGFERLMGSVDVDSLLAQHVGGGLGGAGGGMMPPAMPNNDDPPPRRREARRPDPNENIDNNDQNEGNHDNDNNEEEEEDDAPNLNNQSRKSGKKARRRNLEQRREMRRQREAALQMGFADGENQQDMIAMQRLIEEQIAQENANA